MGNFFTIDESNFNWDYNEEPHKSRRTEILKKHPEIKKLMKKDGDRKLIFDGILVSILHVLVGVVQCYFDSRPLKTLYIACLGPWLATVLVLHVHEASHGLVFGPNHVWKNRLYGYFINLTMGTPMYSLFKRNHKNHHKYIGDEVLDAEYPSELEAKLFSRNCLLKWCWFLINPFVAIFRTPAFVLKHCFWEVTLEEIINHVIVQSLNICLLYNGWVDLWIYFMFSNLLCLESHMFGFWGVSSHVEFLRNKETTSYYGWMNRLYLNFGYHMEHHDFPSVPSRFLPEIKRLAPEYYDESFTFDSLYSASLKFLFDDKIGVRSRLKRPAVQQAKYTKICGENFRKFQT